MKKVKVMLVAALVVASVGGALAFKSQAFSESFKCGDAIDHCPDRVDNLKTTTSNPIPNVFCTTINGSTSDCPLSVTSVE